MNKKNIKFSGSGSLPLKQFGKFFKKKTRKDLENKIKEITKNEIKAKELASQLIKEYYNPNKEKEKNKIIKRMENKNDFSEWEKQVMNVLGNSGIKFEKKFRKFPIKINEKISINYVPDFLLDSYEINKKEVIIEAHEELTSDDVVKYSLFMKKYFHTFYVIMIVKENQLKEWNKINSSNRLFSDIWLIHNLDELVDWIKQKKTKRDDSHQQAKCPHCEITGIGIKQIAELFGHRKKNNGEKYPQSLCKECRNLQVKLGTEGLKKFRNKQKQELSNEIKRFCTGCDSYFKTKLSNESFCVECTKKFWGS